MPAAAAPATPEPFMSPIAGAAAILISPGTTNEVVEDHSSCWYAFYSEHQKREYYYNPESGRSTWVLPAGARRFTDPRMIDINPGFTPVVMGRFSFDMFEDKDDENDGSDSVHSENGPWKEKLVLKANLIVLGMFMIGMVLSVACYAFNVGGALASAANKLDAVQANVARNNAIKLQTDLQRRNDGPSKSTLYYSSWLNVLNDPSVIFSVHEDMTSISESRNGHEPLSDNSQQHALYYPSWWNVLENARDPPRDVELDHLVHNLVSSLETADVLLNKLVMDAQQAGMELRNPPRV